MAKPGSILVIKGAKTSDYKGRTLFGYEDTTALYIDVT
jgi:hypothetical protein